MPAHHDHIGSVDRDSGDQAPQERDLGERTPARRRTTLNSVARDVGVSPTLVSFALNDRPGVAAETKARIVEAAERLGYRPDARAKSLRTGRTGVVGLVVRNVANPFFSRLLAGMQDGAVEDGVSVLALDSRYDARREADMVRTLAAQKADALAVAPVGDGPGLDLWSRLMPGRPSVAVNSLTHPEAASVCPDNEAAVRLAFEHLRSLGHRRIAMVSAPSGLMADGDRLSVYNRLCTEADLPSLPVFGDLRGPALLPALVDLLSLEDRPTAIITNSDYTATFVYATAQELGLRIGSDVSVVGHDDATTSAFMGPPLTTIAVDVEEMGRQTYSRLVTPGLRDHLQPVQLKVRASTGQPPRRV